MDETRGPNGEPSEEDLFNHLTNAGQVKYGRDFTANHTKALADLRAGKYPFQPGFDPKKPIK